MQSSVGKGPLVKLSRCQLTSSFMPLIGYSRLTLKEWWMIQNMKTFGCKVLRSLLLKQSRDIRNIGKCFERWRPSNKNPTCTILMLRHIQLLRMMMNETQRETVASAVHHGGRYPLISVFLCSTNEANWYQFYLLSGLQALKGYFRKFGFHNYNDWML